MKKLLLLLIVFGLVPYIASAQPSASFPDTKFDFGSVASTDKVEHTFSFLNTGTEPLIIGKISAG